MKIVRAIGCIAALSLAMLAVPALATEVNDHPVSFEACDVLDVGAVAAPCDLFPGMAIEDGGTLPVLDRAIVAGMVADDHPAFELPLSDMAPTFDVPGGDVVAGVTA